MGKKTPTTAAAPTIDTLTDTASTTTPTANTPAADPDRDIIAAIGQTDINRFLYIVDEASQLQDRRLANFIRDKVATDLQSNLDRLDHAPACPHCNNTRPVKNGRRRNIQRYKCPECGTRFTATSSTLLEKTNYTWSIWVEVIACMLAGTSIEKTVQIIRDDHHCPIISKDTVHLMRLKVMNAIAALPTPTLTGAVQIDDMFVREGQKASRSLENTLPTDIQPRREPRYGRQPSILGVRAPEFASITCMVDGSGHAASAVLSMGAPSAEVLYDFIAANTRDVSFFCSDADKTYAQVFADMRRAHYVRPSNYLDVIHHAGYVQPSKTDKQAASRQREDNDHILERLWEAEAIDRIENAGRMTYRRFCQMKRDNRLNISRVNEFHSELREALERRTRGVSTKFLPMYVAWLTYLHNRRVDAGHAMASHADAESILLDAVRARVNLTSSDVEDMRRRPMDFPKPSGRYLHMLMRATDDVRLATGEGDFEFADEDAVKSFNKRDILSSLPIGQLRTLARGAHLRSWRERSRTDLVAELAGKPEVDSVLYLIAAGKTERDWGEDEVRALHATDTATAADISDTSTAPAASIDDERTFPQQRYDSFGHRKTAGRYKGACAPREGLSEGVLFIDIETTGTSFSTDEVLSIAIVNGAGEVLLDSLVKPAVRKRWTRTEHIHHITPVMVQDAPTLDELKERIEGLLNGAEVVCGWNHSFDLRMLYACGVDVDDDANRRLDLMSEYCDWRQMQDKSFTKRQEKLTEAARYLGLPHIAHNALGNVVVLLDIWRAIAGE